MTVVMMKILVIMAILMMILMRSMMMIAFAAKGVSPVLDNVIQSNIDIHDRPRRYNHHYHQHKHHQHHKHHDGSNLACFIS